MLSGSLLIEGRVSTYRKNLEFFSLFGYHAIGNR